MKPLIKICGINDFNVLQQLVSMDNINYLGFIFYEKSVRNVSPEFLGTPRIPGRLGPRPGRIQITYLENKCKILSVLK